MLARGGMAVVYLVRQPALDREVVLKRLDLERDDPTLAQRFVREARLAAALDHPNVVTLFDFFERDGVPYIAMEYVAGGSLRSLVGALELPQVLGVLEGTLAGLGHAERHGIAHRDLKPENILVTRRGNVKIADFGIARAYNALSQRLTITGKAMGTPVYMAPEQALDKPIGPPTDLYALGVIVYELLAGRPPFEADLPIGRALPPRPRAAAAAAGVDPVPRCASGSDGCSRRRRADRPQSAGEAWHGARGDRGRGARPVLAPGGHDHDPDRRSPSTTRRRRPRSRARTRRASGPRTRWACPSRRQWPRGRSGARAGVTRWPPADALVAVGVAATLAATLPDDPGARKPLAASPCARPPRTTSTATGGRSS